ncbi:MAG: 7TM-DISM domain-containing protein, partial [Myxococcota bacterium]|nr:7TM-DISM domain-containing protein [Myxococcota bacterium]
MTLLGALVVVLVLLSSPATANTPPSIAPNASPGTLDLSSWPLHTKALALETVWDVWWNVLDTQPAGPAHAQVAIPSKWEGDAPQPTSARPGTGHATYQLKVTGLPHDLTELGMYVRTLGLSYRLTARDSTGHERLILSSGHPGASPETTVPWEVPQIGSFKKLMGPTLLFTIEISNYHYAHGGPWRAPVLGPERALRQTLLQEQFTDFALVGLLAIVALYHFALFLVRRKDKASLWFALFLSCLLVRHACTGRLFELFLFDASAEVYEFRNRIEFLSMYLLLPLVWQFLHTVFPEAFGKRSRNIIAGIFAVFASTCLLHVSSYSQLLPAFHAIVLPAGITAMVFLGRAILAGHPQSKLTFGAFSAVLGTSVHDILVVFFNLDHPWLLAYGIAAFVLLQSYVIAQLFAEAYQRATNLTSALSQEITSRRAVEGELHDVQTRLDGAKQELKD